MYKNSNTKKIKTYVKLFLGGSVFFGIFAFIYEMFSHEVYSNAMIFSFAIPLMLGLFPMLLLFFILLRRGHFTISSTGLQLYAGGVFMLTVGSVMKGVLEIYGTTNQKIVMFPILGIVLLIAGVLILFLKGNE